MRVTWHIPLMSRYLKHSGVSNGWRDWWLDLGEWRQTPASLSGQHHKPGQTQAEHARAVYRLACKHWRRCPWPEVRHNHKIHRSFLRAALFHDVGKSTDRYNHDIASYVYLIQKKDLLAAVLALTHMGRWGSKEVHDLLEMPKVRDLWSQAPVRWMAQTIQACDYQDAVCYDIA